MSLDRRITRISQGPRDVQGNGQGSGATRVVAIDPSAPIRYAARARPPLVEMTVNSSKPTLSISFHNFWRGFDAKNSFFARALGAEFHVNVDKVGRDVQISSVMGTEPLPLPPSGTRPLRVWFTGEAREPQGQLFDLFFGFRAKTPLLGGRWHRFPLWITYLDWWDPASPFHFGKLLAPNRGEGIRPRFCNFIYSAPAAIRSEFFVRLNEVRPVDSFGRLLNNQGGHRPRGRLGKMKVLSESTFTIAFENQVAPGYVTEKLVEPLLAGSIPIYWGAPEAKADFNADAFIFAGDFATFDELVVHVIDLASSPDAIRTLTAVPAFRDGHIPYEHRPEFFVDVIRSALSGGAAPFARTRSIALSLAASEGIAKALKRRVRKFRDAFRG